MKYVLGGRLQIAVDRFMKQPEIIITYSQLAGNKGRAYVTVISTVKKINEHDRLVVMTNRTANPIDEIIRIKRQIFETS